MVTLDAGEWREGHERELPVADPQTGFIRADWPVTDYIQTGEEWPPGQYLAALRLASGDHAGSGCHVPFVVGSDPDATPAPTLLLMPVTTAQACNAWGGPSMAASEDGSASAVRVSFDRPMLPLMLAAPSARFPLWWDLPLLRFLECEGLELDYACDLDVHRDPDRLLQHSLVMLSGHGAYWSMQIRGAFERAVRRGVNIACMGADTGSRRIVYEDGERTIAAYPAASGPPDPGAMVTWFRRLKPPRPECELFGVQSAETDFEQGAVQPYVVTEEGRDDPWLEGTELRPETRLPGLVGDAVDALQAGHKPSGATVLLEGQDGSALPAAHAIRFTAPTGALVFSAGSLRFAAGLEEGILPGEVLPGLQRLVQNALVDLLQDRRVEDDGATERELARLPEQRDPGLLPLTAEIPIRVRAGDVWPPLADALAEWRDRASEAIAPWDGAFNGDMDAYLAAGESALWNIARALAGAGNPTPGVILDFPCRAGRVTRALRAAWPGATLVAADVSPTAIEFCAASFDAEAWKVVSHLRPDDPEHRDRYDLIWCGSLLSQLHPSQVGRCLSSLLRLLAPNGVLVAAYHGRDSADRLRNSQDPGRRVLAESLARTGTGFHMGEDGRESGLSVLAAHWLAAHVTANRGAMLLSLTERGWLDHLDVIAVLRKDVHHPHGDVELR
jgi:SAM-dependent methyltransferase